MADKKISALTSATTPLAGTEVLPIVQGGSTVKVAVSDLTAGRAVGANGLTSTANIRTEYSAAGNVTTITNNTSSAAGATSQLYNVNDAARALRIQYSSSGGAGGSAVTNGISTETAQIFTDGNFPIVLGTNVSAALILDTSQNARIINNLIVGTAGKGIDFSAATHAAGMTSELLNDYEEGTFTPVASQLTTAPTIVYASQTGKYTKVGRVVTAHIELILTTVVGGLGTTVITGLPYAPDEGTYGGQGMIGYNDALANTVYGCWVSGTSVVFRNGARSSANDTGGWSSGGYLALTLVYQV